MVDFADPWDVVTTTNPTARKPHSCGECGRTIQPGERYERTEGKSSYGGWLTYLVCPHCEVLGDWLTGICNGYIFNHVIEDVREHLDEGIGGMDVARAYFAARMRWTSRRTGELMPVPDPLIVPERPRWAA
jgi:hypothetical protein